MSTPTSISLSIDAYLPQQVSAENLKGKSIRGAAVTGVGQVSKFLLRFASIAVLARMLTPNDFGLIAMTTVITGFFTLFSEAGLSAATVQRRDLSHQQVSTLFWINLGLGVLLALLVVALSPVVAWFYQDARLVSVTMALSLTFILAGAGVQHRALLRRQMRLSVLAVIDILATVVGLATAILMAWFDFGYWALVGMSLGISLTMTLSLWLVLPWKPSLPQRGVEVRSLLKFGGDVLTFDLLNYFSRNVDSILIGKFIGAAALGIYNKAYSLLLLPLNQINRPLASVAAPALARQSEEMSRFRAYFLNAMKVLSSATLPMVFAMALFADQIVFIVLGEAWMKCADLFRLLAVGAAVRAITNPTGWVLVSLGRTREYRIMGLITAGLIVSGFLVGIGYGVSGVALSYSIVMGLMLIPLWWYVLRGTGITLRKIFGVIAPGFFSCLMAGAVSLSFVVFLESRGEGPLVTGLVGGSVFAAGYSLVLLIGFRQLKFFLNIAGELRPTKK